MIENVSKDSGSLSIISYNKNKYRNSSTLRSKTRENPDKALNDATNKLDSRSKLSVLNNIVMQYNENKSYDRTLNNESKYFCIFKSNLKSSPIKYNVF